MSVPFYRRATIVLAFASIAFALSFVPGMCPAALALSASHETGGVETVITKATDESTMTVYTDDDTSLEETNDRAASIEDGNKAVSNNPTSDKAVCDEANASAPGNASTPIAPAEAPAKDQVEVEWPKVPQATKAGWVKSADGSWYYFVSAGAAPSTGWLLLGQTWYYLDPSHEGAMLTGRYQVEKTWYASDSSGAMHANQWTEQPEGWYYAAESGALKTGWLLQGGTWYWLEPTRDGLMAENEWITDGGKRYYLGASGAMATGWYRPDKTWYFADPSGAQKTGWLSWGGSWYWLDASAKGAMAENGSKTVDGAIYAFADGGAMATGWHKLDGRWYYADSSGARVKGGWICPGGTWYWLEPTRDGLMAENEWITDGGKRYYLGASGAMATGWYRPDKTWYFAEPSGAQKTGWLSWGGSWYWLDPDAGGAMAENGTKTVDGAIYAFADGGAMRANCQVRLEGEKCGYAASSGAITQIGVFRDGKVILQDAKGKPLTGWQAFAGKWFYGDADATMHTGWLDLSGTKYYLDTAGVMLTGFQRIDGKQYYFSGSGALSASPYANPDASARLVSAANYTAYQGNGYCAKWTNSVYVNAGYPHPDGNACDLYWKYCGISDLSLMEPGMIIAVPSHTRSGLGSIYGHVAIYMGDGIVRHNVSRLESISLSSWLDYYQTTYAAKCGWAFY